MGHNVVNRDRGVTMRLLAALLGVVLLQGIPGASAQAGSGGTADPPDNSVAVGPKPCIPIERLYQWHVIYTNRAYSGVRVYTCEKRLEDGTIFKATRANWEWRDSQGRVRVDRKERIPESSKVHNVQVYDPVKHVSWSWSVGDGDRTAVLVRYKATEDFVQPELNRRILPDGTVDPPFMAHMAVPDMPRQQQIILTPTNVNGVWAEGERMIRKSFPGDPGNTSNHLEISTDEFWFSVELELEIGHIADDPQQGKSIENLLRIDRAEPNPALFKPPAGYDVLDATPKHPLPQRNPFIVIPARRPQDAAVPN